MPKEGRLPPLLKRRKGIRVTGSSFWAVTLTWAMGMSALPAAAEPQPGAADHPISLALASVTKGEGFTAQQAGTIEEVLLTALGATGRFEVIGRTDMAALLSLEAQKQATGCTDAGCMVQIAGALGAQLVASADVGRLGSDTIITLKVIDVKTAKVLVRAQQIVHADNELVGAARALVEQVVDAVGMPRTRTPLRWSRVAGWGGTILGGVMLAVGAGLAAAAHNAQNAVHTTPRPGETALNLLNKGNGEAVGANVLFGVGGVTTAAGVFVLVRF